MKSADPQGNLASHMSARPDVLQNGGAAGSGIRRRRVLHVSQPTEAGVPNVLLAYAADQLARGWDVHVICPGDEGYLAAAARKLGATHHDWSAQRSPGLSSFAEARRLRRIIDGIDPDVVHLHSSKAGMTGRLAIRGSRPTLFQPHAWSFEAVTGATARWALAWERWAQGWTSVVVCVSQSEADLGRACGVLSDRVAVIPNGVDLLAWQPRDKRAARKRLGVDPAKPAIVVVGRLAHQKGQDLAIRALPAVRIHVPDAELYLVGDGPDREAYAEKADEAVHFVGKVDDPSDWYSSADIVLVPSRWEGMPLVVLEAMAAGAAIVATDVAGVREALGESGPIVRVGEFTALVPPMVNLLRSPHELRAIGADNRRRVEEHFDVRRSCEQMAVLVESLALH